MTVKEFCDQAMDVWGLHDDGTKRAVMSFLRIRYNQLCEKAAFSELRNRVSLTFTGSETDGRWLPSDLIGILAVVSSTEDEERTYHPTTEERRYLLDGRYHYFHPSTRTDPIHSSDLGLTISSDADQAQVGAAASTWVNEYIQIGPLGACFKITAVTVGSDITISPRYYGDPLNDAGYIVRPQRTKKLTLVDDAGDLMADTVTVFYWQYPAPLLRDEDLILLPSTKALELQVWADCVGSIEKRKNEADGYRAEAEAAIADLLMLNPSGLMPAIARNRLGSRVRFGRVR